MSIFKHNVNISIFGESHGEVMGITIHHFPQGIRLDTSMIQDDLKKRHQFSLATSSRKETDAFDIISGFFNGFTTGAPLTILLKNKDVDSTWYMDNHNRPRPSHGDLAAHIKYGGFNDFRGGGHLSGRLMALVVILGSVCRQALTNHAIQVASRIQSLYDIVDASTFDTMMDLDPLFPVIDVEKKQHMLDLLTSLTDDSVGGVVETRIEGMPIGLGNPIFDSFESLMSHLLFSIPGIKGVSFGSGFAITRLKASQANDQMHMQDNKVTYLSNHSGGIQGGMTNGEAILFQTAIKPTPSISIPQATVDLEKQSNHTLIVKGRHDRQIVTKVIHVINAMAYYLILDLLIGENRL